jgi:hypothetical protein
VELSSEIERFKYLVASAAPYFSDTEPISLLNLLVIHKLDVCDTYPHIEIALRIFLTLPITAAYFERSFSELKLIKNYFRLAQNQEHTCNLDIMSIEEELAQQLNYDDINDGFADIKATKVAYIFGVCVTKYLCFYFLIRNQ